MKTQKRLEARRLRINEQLSLKEIAIRLGVAKSSVSLWVRDLPLSIQELQKRKILGWTAASQTRSHNAKIIRRQYQQEGNRLAEKNISNPLFVAGCIAHWSEGEKNRNRASLCNTDPYFLQLWIRFLKIFFDISEIKLRIHISCYLDNGLSKQQIESYWLKQLSVPQTCLTKTTIIRRHPMSSGVKKNRHPYGIVTISIHSTRIVQQIYGATKFIAQINEKDRWVF